MKSTLGLDKELTSASHENLAKTVRLNWALLVFGLGPLIAAIALWVGSLAQFDITHMSDLGLLAILPAGYLLALGLLTTGFIYLVYKQPSADLVLLAYAAALVVMIHATPNILYGTLRYSWAWKHVAIVDYIQRHGAVNPTIETLDAYHNWPGFFSANALITQLAGIPSSLAYAGWGPLFYNLLDLGALVIIFRTLTLDRRLVWSGVWIFFLANWIGQDYFSPQATTYFLYLVVLYVALAWFRDTQMPSAKELLQKLHLTWIPLIHPSRFPNQARRSRFTGDGLTPIERAGLMGIVVLAMVAIASTHQLTPLMLTSALAGLVIFRSLRTRSLPILMAVLTTAWIIYMAVGFFSGNLESVVEGIGELSLNFRSNLINLSTASSGQALIAKMDRGLTALVILLAGLGMLRRLRLGKWDLPALLLAVSPLPMIVISPYGGEILFRVYYFALPFLAFFAAGLFFPDSSKGRSLVTPLLLGAISLLMLVGLGFGYYGKESINYYSKNEVAAAGYIQQNAQPGALIMSAGWDWPLITQNYEFYKYESIANFSRAARLDILKDPVNLIAKEMSYYPSAYLIITYSQDANSTMTGDLPPGSLAAIIAKLYQSPRFRVVYQNPDAYVFTLAPGGGK